MIPVKYWWISIKSTELISNIWVNLRGNSLLNVYQMFSIWYQMLDTSCHADGVVSSTVLFCFVLNLYLNVLDLPHGTVRYAPDNIRSTSRTTNPRQHDDTYASSTRQCIHTYLTRSLLEGNGDSIAPECRGVAVKKLYRKGKCPLEKQHIVR